MHDFFRRIILQLEERKPVGWIRMGSIIYRLDPCIIKIREKDANLISKGFKGKSKHPKALK